MFPDSWFLTQPISKIPSGATVCSSALPGGTHVSVHAATLNTHSALYHRSQEFVPERWLTAGQGRPVEHANDKLEACHPFGLPPRMCIGKGLAVAELRLLVARLVRAFEIGVPEETWSWGLGVGLGSGKLMLL
ncbi:MAG: hypothetical protein Q9181_006521 [Wetmoreana brouardii]